MGSSWVSQFPEMLKRLSTILSFAATPITRSFTSSLWGGVPWSLLFVPWYSPYPPFGACPSCPSFSYPSETIRLSPTCLLALLYPVLPGKPWPRLLLAFPFSLLSPASLCGLKDSQSRKTSQGEVLLWMNRKSQWVSGQ